MGGSAPCCLTVAQVSHKQSHTDRPDKEENKLRDAVAGGILWCFSSLIRFQPFSNLSSVKTLIYRGEIAPERISKAKPHTEELTGGQGQYKQKKKAGKKCEDAERGGGGGG